MPRQILNDGVYFERSPMYHSIMLRGFLDILNLLPEDHSYYPILRDYVIKMGEFFLSALHHNGEIALFNDSAVEIALPPKKLEEYFEKRWGGMMVMPNYSPEYRSGIKEEGVDKIGEFVEEGGTLILLNEASEFAIEGLKLPIINCLKDVKSSDFFCPGSLLRVELNEQSPLGYGVKHDSPILFQGGQAFTVKPGHDKRVALAHEAQHLGQLRLIGLRRAADQFRKDVILIDMGFEAAQSPF